MISGTISAIFDIGIQIVTNYFSQNEWSDGVFKAGTVGFITGGIGGGISKIGSATKIYKILSISDEAAIIINGAATGVVGDLIESVAYDKSITMESITTSIVTGVALGAIDAKIGNYITSKLTTDFSNMSLAQQKQLLQGISDTNITSSKVREIRRALKNGENSEIVDELIEKYGYDIVVGALVTESISAMIEEQE